MAVTAMFASVTGNGMAPSGSKRSGSRAAARAGAWHLTPAGRSAKRQVAAAGSNFSEQSLHAARPACTQRHHEAWQCRELRSAAGFWQRAWQQRSATGFLQQHAWQQRSGACCWQQAAWQQRFETGFWQQHACQGSFIYQG